MPGRQPSSGESADGRRTHAGDFSDTRQTNGSLLAITGSPDRASVSREPHPGQDRINATGRAMLNLLPLPNGYTDPRPGQQSTANFQMPEFARVHFAATTSIRWTPNLTDNRTTCIVKYIKDREDTTSYEPSRAGRWIPAELRARLGH